MAHQLLFVKFYRNLRTQSTINALNIPFTEKLRLILMWKLELLAEMSPEFIEEYVHVESEFKDFLLQYKQRNVKRFTDCIINWQKKGDIRPDIRPEFFISFITKIQEMFDDDTLRTLYNNNVEFTNELSKTFFYGIVPHNVSEQK